MRNIDFENIEQKYDDTLISKEWKKFEQDFKDSDDIYYHKFQLNTTTLTPFGGEEQATQAGSYAGAGGSGTSSGVK